VGSDPNNIGFGQMVATLKFKSKIPLYFVSYYPHLTGGCICTWSFFRFGHGKGPHHGAGVILKRFI